MTTSSFTPELSVLEPYEFTVSMEMNAAYLEAEEGNHLRYVLGVGGRPPIVHPGLLLNHSNSTKSPSFRVGPTEAALHARDETWFLRPAYVGTKLRVTWAPGDRWEKRGRVYTATDTLLVDEEGREIIRRRLISTTTSDAQPIGENTAPRQQLPETPAARDPASAIGLALTGAPKAVTLERMRLFSGWPTKNIHTDEATARAAGCPAPIASATQNMGHLCDLLLDHFGEAWLTSGTLTVSFVRPIYAGDTVIARAAITGFEPTADGTRYTLDVSAINQDRQPVTVGRATALWPG